MTTLTTRFVLGQKHASCRFHSLVNKHTNKGNLGFALASVLGVSITAASGYAYAHSNIDRPMSFSSLFSLSRELLLQRRQATQCSGYFGWSSPSCNGTGTSPPSTSWRSKHEDKMSDNKYKDKTAVYTGSANQDLAKEIADCLDTQLGDVKVDRFADGEVSIKFMDSLRGKDVFLIQATSPPVNEHLVELLLMISTSRRSSAKKITAVIPYYGYARQDRKSNSRVPISAADVARMIETMGVDRVVSVDLHCGQIQGFFGPNVPVDNLEAQIIGLDYFAKKTLVSPAIVSPDAGGVHRARKFQEGLRNKGQKDARIAMLIKQRTRPNEVDQMDLVGNIRGCDCIIVDDMIDTAGTLCEAARQLKARGAIRVFAFATHGLFSGAALERIDKSELEEVVITNSIRQDPEKLKNHPKIKQISVGPLIADAIRLIHQKESLQDLFKV